jgi:predicted Zn-dependent protease
MAIIKYLFIYFITSQLIGCATNTMTGRTQLSLVSETTVASRATSYYSSMMSDLDKKSKVVTDTATIQRIESITNRLIQQAVLYLPKSAEWDWQVKVIDDDKTVNAFCMPGGLMAIYTGLIKQLDASDDEIGQVMGHEIGHALAGHGAEKMSVQIASNMAVLAISAAVSNNKRDFQKTNDVLTVAALAFVNLPNSRVAETESDRIGIELAARAGYAPEAAVTLWEKMGKSSNSKGKGDFFSTHPAPERRQENLRILAQPMAPLYLGARDKSDPPYDWLHANKLDRPRPSPTEAIAFYSESWEKFRSGEIELKGNNYVTYLVKNGDMAQLYEKREWRNLALQVISSDFQLDLTYFYLAKAAEGLGFDQAASKYSDLAKSMRSTDETSCGKRFLISCSGVDFPL